MKKEGYWFYDLNVLFQLDKLDSVIPTSEMTYQQKTNAIVRLSIYLGIVFSVFTKNYLYLYIPLVTMAFSYVLYLLKKVDEESNNNINTILNITNNNNIKKDDVMKDHLTVEGLSEPFTRTGKTNKCVKSTVHNPFMNPSPFAPRDISNSCSPLSSNSKDKIRNNFNKNLFKDASDIFNSRNGFRQFYTVPGNTFPNDRDTFMKWCYATDKSCKEGNGEQCFKNLYHDPRGIESGKMAAHSGGPGA
jgi:hypothetical protein